MEATQVNLTDVPETMLWTLHNRVSCPDEFKDEKAEEIYRAIDYDYHKSFGKPDGSHAARSQQFDGLLRDFLAEQPRGVIVNLGEGLETQRYRVKGEEALWICVDLPEAIAAREQFIQPDAQHLHIKKSALDPSWMEAVPSDRPVYITAQGLLMYFKEEEVKLHLQAVAERLPGARYAFDIVPPWLSKLSMREGGWMKTPSYRVPPVPWGIQRGKAAKTFRSWVPTLKEVRVGAYHRFSKSSGFLLHYLAYWASNTPGVCEFGPAVAQLEFGS